jgi:acid phosphatase family membrane protein YuiD
MKLDQISPYLITILVAWVVAHIVKFIISSINKERRTLRAYLFVSGGMPSAHSATTVAMVTIIGLKNGINSGLFGLALLFAIIVMYDAVKVRRSSGEQGIAIHKLAKEMHSKIKLPRIAKGHTPAEVVLGAILGIIIGIVVFLSTM